MNRLLSSVALLCSFFAVNAQAQVVVVPPSHGGDRVVVTPPVSTHPRAIEGQARGIANALRNHGHLLDARSLARLQVQLERAVDILARAGIPVENDPYGGGGGGGGVIVTPPVSYVSASATCHIDDDPNFDAIENMGELRGASVDQLVDDCRTLAELRHGRSSSSMISNLRVDNAPSGYVLALCETDDDPNFDRGINRVGTLAAVSISEAQRQCLVIAQAAYGTSGSAGITVQGYAP